MDIARSAATGADSVDVVPCVNLGVRLTFFECQLGHVYAGGSCGDDIAHSAFTARMAGCQWGVDGVRRRVGEESRWGRQRASVSRHSRLVGFFREVLGPDVRLKLLRRGELIMSIRSKKYAATLHPHTFCSSIESLSAS